MTVLDNPFRQGADRPGAPEPCVFVLFGATGDLTARKIVPALYTLAESGLLPQDFYLLGVARRPKDDAAWAKEMHEAVAQHARLKPKDDTWGRFAGRVGYHPLEFNDAEAYARLAQRLKDVERTYGTRGNRLFYLSVPPDFFDDVTDQLADHGLLDGGADGEGWARVVIEKPFGFDLASAEALDQHLCSLMREDQIYRIDHYLGKETVQNLFTLRFGNSIFEPLWNRQWIEHVQITVAESVGMEGRRGDFYEDVGALRDMVQNHMMQLLALTAMEPPVAWSADAIHDEKAKVLASLGALTPDAVADRAVRGQYTAGSVLGEAVPGYREEDGVADDSVTETYVAVRVELETWRWSGVPFYLRHGKRLPKRATEIAVTFKRPPLDLFPDADQGAASGQPAGNILSLRIQPDEGISLAFVSKVPGQRLRRQQVKMEFNYGRSFGVPSPEAYERLLLDAMAGDRTLFTRSDEVRESWRFVTSLLDAWADQPADTVQPYPAGTWGPPAAERLLRPGHEWRRL